MKQLILRCVASMICAVLLISYGAVGVSAQEKKTDVPQGGIVMPLQDPVTKE